MMRWKGCIYPFHEELDVIFEINNHCFGGSIYDSSSEESNEEPKYLEPIEKPSIHSTGYPGTNIIISILIQFPTKHCSLLSAPLCLSFRFNLTVKSTSPGKYSSTSPL